METPWQSLKSVNSNLTAWGLLSVCDRKNKEGEKEEEGGGGGGGGEEKKKLHTKNDKVHVRMLLRAVNHVVEL